MKKLFLFIQIAFIFYSCGIYKDIRIDNIRQLQFEEFDNDGIKGNLKVTIENPNWFDVEIVTAEIDLGLQGRSVATVNLTEPLVVPKHSKNEYLLKISGTEAKLEDAVLSAVSIIFSDKVVISGEGYVIGKALKIKKKAPLSFEYPINKSDLRKKK